MDDPPRSPAPPQDTGALQDTWTAQDAQARLGEVLDAALAGKPQRVTQPSGEAAVVISEREWRGRQASRQEVHLGEHLLTFPGLPDDVDLMALRERERRRTRPDPFGDS